MRYEWDPAKAAANLVKHGVRFEDAMLVFDDPFHRSRQDRHEDGEERWQTLGMVDGLVLLLVAHTSPADDHDHDHDHEHDTEHDAGEVTRIISARRATKQERREYEQGR